MSQTMPHPEITVTHLFVRPWPDAVIDRLGFEPSSGYVELCWLPILGPSATWALRRITAGLIHNPDGFTLSIADLGKALGIGGGVGRNAVVVRTLRRLMHFELARSEDAQTMAIRTKIPPLPHRHLTRLAPQLQRAHDRMTSSGPSSGPTAA